MTKRITKETSRSSFKKKRQKRKFLIISEGKKTEVLYFKAIKNEYRQIIEIIPKSSTYGTDPQNIVEFACDELQKMRKKRAIYKSDAVFCVFDTEISTGQPSEISQRQVKTAVKTAKPKSIEIILSNPCFEFWFLLHFSNTNAQLSNAEAIQRLKQHIPNYQKNKCCFNILKNKLKNALNNAEKLEEYFSNDQNLAPYDIQRNPSSLVYKIFKEMDIQI